MRSARTAYKCAEPTCAPAALGPEIGPDTVTAIRDCAEQHPGWTPGRIGTVFNLPAKIVRAILDGRYVSASAALGVAPPDPANQAPVPAEVDGGRRTAAARHNAGNGGEAAPIEPVAQRSACSLADWQERTRARLGHYLGPRR